MPYRRRVGTPDVNQQFVRPSSSSRVIQRRVRSSSSRKPRTFGFFSVVPSRAARMLRSGSFDRQLNRVLNSAQYGNIAISFGLNNTGEIGSAAFINAINTKFKPSEFRMHVLRYQSPCRQTFQLRIDLSLHLTKFGDKGARCR